LLSLIAMGDSSIKFYEVLHFITFFMVFPLPFFVLCYFCFEYFISFLDVLFCFTKFGVNTFFT